MSDICLRVKRIEKRFGGLVALDKVDLDIKKDEVLGLIGPNGSGKTTFFNILTGIYPASGGSVVFEGQDITNQPPQVVYKSGVSRTFQRSRLCLELSVFDNVAIGDHPRLNHGFWHNIINRRMFWQEFQSCRNRVIELIDQFAPHLLDKMDHPVGGFPMIDRRRIEVCRALLGEPKLLLLDEPSAGMTEEETRQLTDEVLEIRKRKSNLSVIIIEHEMGVISKITDRCVVFNFGRKICEGVYAKVASNKQVQKAYLGEDL
ncbi:MAG: ABC transporter ATP-binding protein [Pseudomonadota bacterium]